MTKALLTKIEDLAPKISKLKKECGLSTSDIETLREVEDAEEYKKDIF